MLFLIPQNLNSLNFQAILILEWITSALSTFNTTTEVRPLSKAPNPQLFPWRRSSVCVCGGVLNAEHNFRVWVTILGHTSLSLN